MHAYRLCILTMCFLDIPSPIQRTLGTIIYASYDGILNEQLFGCVARAELTERQVCSVELLFISLIPSPIPMQLVNRLEWDLGI